MKSIACLALSVLSFQLSAQLHFEKGFIITKEGNRTECLIKNRKWLTTPQEVIYKLDENSEVKTASPADLRGWGVGDSEFVSGEVNFDQSTMDVAKIDYDKQPVWVRKTLFIQLLVSGKASLYVFDQGDGNRFFMSTPNDSTIRQLVNKPFHTSSMDVYYNDLYRAQLLSEMVCDGLTTNTEEVLYTRASLRNYFMKYNGCIGVPAKRIGGSRRLKFHLSVTPGADLSKFRAESSAVSTGFDEELSFRYGAEIELELPFNNSKWALFVEPTYQTYEATNPFPAKLRSIEVPVGVRHYFHLTNSIRVFANAAGVFDHALETTAKYHELFEPVDAKNSIVLSAAFGAGIKVWRFSAEARYYAPRSRPDSKRMRHFEQEKVSLIVGMRIF